MKIANQIKYMNKLRELLRFHIEGKSKRETSKRTDMSCNTGSLSPEYLMFQIVDWVDDFTSEIYRKEILDSFAYCRKHKGLLLYG